MFNTLNPMAASTSVQPVIDLPERFVCRITREIIKDPVTASDNGNYERSAVEAWFAISANVNSPFNNLPYQHRRLIPNPALKAEIAEWRRINMPETPIKILSFAELQSTPSASHSPFAQNGEEPVWYQKQARLWEQAKSTALKTMPAIQTAEMRDTLSSRLNSAGTIDHHTARVFLLQGATTTIQRNLRVNAIKERNTELVELLCFHQKLLFTAEDYTLAIKHKNSTTFLSWMLEMIAPQESHSSIQQETAKIYNAALMLKALEKTGGFAFDNTIKAVIKNENISVLPTVLDKLEQSLEEDSNHEQRCIEFSTLALQCKDNKVLTIILNKLRPAGMPSDLYNALSHHFNPASLQALITAGVPLPSAAIYSTLLDAFILKINKIQQAIDTNNSRLLSEMRYIYHYPEEACLIFIIFLGCTSMFTFGVLYYTNQVNEAIKRHPNDDSVDDDRRQHHQNHVTGICLIAFGGFFLIMAACVLIESLYRLIPFYKAQLNTYYSNQTLQAEKKQLTSGFQKIIGIFADNNIQIHTNDLPTLINTSDSVEIKNAFTEAYRKTNDPSYQPSRSWCAKFCNSRVDTPIILGRPAESDLDTRLV